MKLSYTQLKKFSQCPRAYRYEYIDKIKTPEYKTAEAYMGRKIHQALEFLYRSIYKGTTPKLDEILTVYQCLWLQDMDSQLIINNTNKSMSGYMQEGMEYVSRYYHKYQPFNQGEVVGVELKIKADLSGDGRYIFTGFIDRLDLCPEGRYEIHDYKTGLRFNRKDIQLPIYEIAVRQTMADVVDVELVWHLLKHMKELRCKHSSEQLNNLRMKILSKVYEIEEAVEYSVYPPKRSRLCLWCRYYKICCSEYVELKQSKIVDYVI